MRQIGPPGIVGSDLSDQTGERRRSLYCDCPTENVMNNGPVPDRTVSDEDRLRQVRCAGPRPQDVVGNGSDRRNQERASVRQIRIPAE